MNDIKNDNQTSEAWYRSTENQSISPSKAKAFRKSKSYYHSRYVLGTMPDEPTPSMLIGSMVDAAWSAGNLDEIAKRFTTEKGDDTKIKVRPSDADKALGMASALLALDVLPDGEVHTQEPIYTTVTKRAGKRNVHIGLCGLPDRFIVHHDKNGRVESITLIDLKTARLSDLESEKAWYWKCVRSGYFEQLAAYAGILQRIYGIGPHKVKARHIVISNTEDMGRYPIRLYKIPRTLYSGLWSEFVATAFAIKKETVFRDPEPAWEVLHDPAEGDLPGVNDDEE